MCNISKFFVQIIFIIIPPIGSIFILFQSQIIRAEKADRSNTCITIFPLRLFYSVYFIGDTSK